MDRRGSTQSLASMDRLEHIRRVIDEIVHQQPDAEERRCGFVHLYGVSQACVQLAIKRGLDEEAGAIAGMLHDLWSYQSGDSANHAERSAFLAQEIMQKMGAFPEAEITEICDAISRHSAKHEVDSPLAELLKDADVLQHYLYDPRETAAAPQRLQRVLDELELHEAIFLAKFQPADQVEVKALILRGLQEHWGSLDPHRNPDLNDIARTYKNAIFLVARQSGRVIGTGALVPRSEDTGEVVRMSVARELRRKGLGSQILNELQRQARQRGLRRLILETTETWSEVIAFYHRHGFEITHYQDGDVYFKLDLVDEPGQA